MERGGQRLYMGLQRGGVGWAGQRPKEPLGQWGCAGHRVAHLAVSCPCRVMGQAGGPCTALAFVSCRHGHAAFHAVPPRGRAVGRATGPWAVWKYITITWLHVGEVE
jgi:hypothetical protein